MSWALPNASFLPEITRARAFPEPQQHPLWLSPSESLLRFRHGGTLMEVRFSECIFALFPQLVLWFLRNVCSEQFGQMTKTRVFKESASSCWACLPDHRGGSWHHSKSMSFSSKTGSYLELSSYKGTQAYKCGPQNSVQTLVKGLWPDEHNDWKHVNRGVVCLLNLISWMLIFVCLGFLFSFL